MSATPAHQLNALDQATHFLRHAPALFSSPLLPQAAQQPLLVRLHLPLPHHNEPVACFRDPDSGRYLVTGTDLLRMLLFRFRCLARPLPSLKKFEEGVFSDLRNLKVPEAARLEPARSPLLDTLYRFGCVRTQKRQKVFYWDAVDHERLFRDAWEREARREREAGAGTALAPLDEATMETAAAWHRTRPLLLTYVRSVQDPVERPLNAADPALLAEPELEPEPQHEHCAAALLERMAPEVPQLVEEELFGLAPFLPPVTSLPSAHEVTVDDPFVMDLPALASHTVPGSATYDPMAPRASAPLTSFLPPWIEARAVEAASTRSSLSMPSPVTLPPMEQRLMQELEAFLTPPRQAVGAAAASSVPLPPRLNTADLPPSVAQSLRTSISSSPRRSSPAPSSHGSGAAPKRPSSSLAQAIDSAYVSARPRAHEGASLASALMGACGWPKSLPDLHQTTPPCHDLGTGFASAPPSLLGKRSHASDHDDAWATFADEAGVTKRARTHYF